MEAKKEEFIVTQEWLAEMKACKGWLRAFKKHFPNGGEALEVLKRCEELDYTDFGEWLVDRLPPIYPPLVLNTFVGNLFIPMMSILKAIFLLNGVFTSKEVLR